MRVSDQNSTSKAKLLSQYFIKLIDNGKNLIKLLFICSYGHCSTEKDENTQLQGIWDPHSLLAMALDSSITLKNNMALLWVNRCVCYNSFSTYE